MTTVPPSEIIPQAAAVLVLGAVRLALWSLSFSRVMALVERVSRPRSPRRPEALALVARRVRRAARLVPHATCLPQALAGRVLLARAGHASRVRFGVAAPSDRGFEAHAWLECDGAVVVGAVPGQPLTPFPDLPPADTAPRER